MKLNLSPQAVEAIALLQDTPDMIEMLSGAEDFILEMDETNQALTILNHVKGIRCIRKLLENIVAE